MVCAAESAWVIRGPRSVHEWQRCAVHCYPRNPTTYSKTSHSKTSHIQKHGATAHVKTHTRYAWRGRLGYEGEML